MALRVKQAPHDTDRARLDLPLNPSVRGTAKQSGRGAKGLHAKRTSLHRSEGAGNRRQGGRGGKAGHRRQR